MDLIVFLLDSIVTPEGRPSLYALLLTIAGIFMIVGLRKTSISLIAITLAMLVMGSPAFESLLDSIVDQLPNWAYWPLMAVMAYGFVRWIMVRILGEEKGGKATRKGLFWLLWQGLSLPFRLFGGLLGGGPTGRWIALALLLAAAVSGYRWLH